ncbi:hypothetical protein EVAR_76649_1 [Eumeta japonica]|uniref:Uncharacterized protein n=1 Tax=Eumeta variegata TaxID=151549 RepID=A0A4C1T804_EUMVA|nr:hypothetical protein EVAR_76649_1 [Eumeta japonica]
MYENPIEDLCYVKVDRHCLYFKFKPFQNVFYKTEGLLWARMMAHPPAHMSCIHYIRRSMAMHFAYFTYERSFVLGSFTPNSRVRVRDGGLASCPGVFSSTIRPRRSSVGTPTSSSTVTAVSGSDGEVKCVPRTRGGAERGERTEKGRGTTMRVALMGALRIPGAMRAHDGRDAGSQHAGGALPETISP